MLSLDNQEKKKFTTIKATAANFVDSVIQESLKKLVVVLFSIESNRDMQVILERILIKSQDEVLLAVVDTQKESMLVQQLGIEGVPTVLIFKDGKPLTGFAGMQSEENINKVFAKLLNLDTTTKQSLELALKSYKENDFNTALTLYSEVLEKEQDNIKAIAGAIHCYVFLGYISTEIFENLDAKIKTKPEIVKLQEAYNSLTELKNGSYGKQIEEMLGGTNLSDNMDKLLENLFSDKDTIKKIIISITTLMGNEHSLSANYLRKLTTLLYV